MEVGLIQVLENDKYFVIKETVIVQVGYIIIKKRKEVSEEIGNNSEFLKRIITRILLF